MVTMTIRDLLVLCSVCALVGALAVFAWAWILMRKPEAWAEFVFEACDVKYGAMRLEDRP